MPPIRTEKSNSAADAPAPGTDAPKKRLLKPVVKGIKDARFQSSAFDWDGQYHKLIGTSTRKIEFGSSFVLTDDHIDDILTLPRQVREKIWHFIFIYGDVSYNAKNTAKDVTGEAIVRLAEGLPNLRTVSIPSADAVGDKGFLALISHCRDLKLLDMSSSISSYHANNITGEALEEFFKHPEWCPDLKQVVLHRWGEDKKEFMKPLRELSRQRDKLVITLLDRRQTKKWGDWELETYPYHYIKGRKCDRKLPAGIAHRCGEGF